MSDRKVVGHLANVANAPGSGAGASVTTAVSGLRLPPVYVVQVAASQDAVAFVTGKTASGFSVTLSPRLAANTLAAGTFDVLIVG
jgi:hypothetical protein